MGKLTGTMLAVAGAIALTACGGGDSNAPTAEESRELDNAAAMLDENATDASPDSLTVEEAPIGNGDAGTAATGDALVGGGDNAITNGAVVNAQ